MLNEVILNRIILIAKCYVCCNATSNTYLVFAAFIEWQRNLIGLLQLVVTWQKIRHTGTHKNVHVLDPTGWNNAI